MFHKLAGGLEVAVANSAERPQGLFGDLGTGRQAKWAAGSNPRRSQAGPSETSPPTCRPTTSVISRLCCTEQRQTPPVPVL